MHQAFTQAFKEREAQLHNFTHQPDLYYYTWPVPWGQRFDYAVNFRAMMQRNLETGMTRPPRMQIVDVNTFEEARALLSVPHPPGPRPRRAPRGPGRTTLGGRRALVDCPVLDVRALLGEYPRQARRSAAEGGPSASAAGGVPSAGKNER